MKLTDINNYEMILEEQENSKDKQSSLVKYNDNIENNVENNLENFSKTKINKPIELKEFDATPHFKENIINYNINCSDPITPSSYYCFTCKHSVCEECGVFDHKEHLLIQRDNCINYDVTFFNEISKVIDDSFLIENKKDTIKNIIISLINNLKKDLDNLKNKKLKEIDFIFNKIKNNLNELKKNFNEAKSSIEEYYNKNKVFFNVSNLPPNSKKENEEEEKINSKNEINFNYEENKEIKNKDLENTIFLMNFELMNLCDNKNLQVLDVINEMNYKINLLIKKFEQKNNVISKELNNLFDLNSCMVKFDDYYLDIKIRTKKYNEFISNFKSILNGIIKKNGNLDKLKDLIVIFDSKNKKNKNFLFNQEYFTKYNNIKNSQNRNSSEKNLKSPHRNKVSSKKKLIKQKNNINSPKLLLDKKNNDLLKQNIRCLTYNNNIIKKAKGNYKQNRKHNGYVTNYKSIKYNSKNKITQSSFIRDNKNIHNVSSFQKTYSQLFDKSDDIILNQRIIQRFFAYSIYDLFYKFFRNDNSISENNITKNNDIARNKYNIGNIEFNQEKKTVSYLANYTERYNQLKEIAKPIIGTNQIQYFDSVTNQIIKVNINLSKIEHGYSVFPFGCRHILIDNILYIVGGADNCGNATNIVLSYNFSQNILLKLPNLNDEHSYHSIEYLENFDSIIIVGGENSTSCEIMDLETKKWTRLPYLNYPRSNTNIYYNYLTYELYALFGMEGEMTEKNKNSDIIEVLKLNDIMSGWSKVDYYRSSGLNLKTNYCITLPFTRDKLLIYGCSSARTIDKKLFAFFNMNKKECIKVDKNTIELIKLEEKKIKFFDFALSKIE